MCEVRGGRTVKYARVGWEECGCVGGGGEYVGRRYNIASFPGPARSSLAVRNSRRIPYCKRRTRRAWERG